MQKADSQMICIETNMIIYEKKEKLITFEDTHLDKYNNIFNHLLAIITKKN